MKPSSFFKTHTNLIIIIVAALLIELTTGIIYYNSQNIIKHPQELLETIGKAVHGFVGGAEQSDDLTMLAIRYTPQQYESTLNETITLKNDVH